MAMTKATAETALTAWIAADAAVSIGQSYSIAGRSLSRVDVGQIREQITYWQNIIESFDAVALGVNNPNVRIAFKTR